MMKKNYLQPRCDNGQLNCFYVRTTQKRGNKLLLPVFLMMLFSTQGYGQGTWSALTNLSPHFNEGVMLLLTDGTVMCKTSSGGTYGNAWDKLTPSSTGSYSAGTWSAIDTMHNDRLYFSTQVLRDGRVYVAGGEYGTGGYKSEVYDPQTNVWTACPPVRPGPYSIVISDANSEILPDGRVLQAVVDTASARLNFIYNPTTNTYSSTASCLRVDNEASWVKLPDQSILFIDNYGTTSERYIPATNTWINDGTVPLSLYDGFGFEAGAAFLLPNGDAFFIGATNHTAYYHPSGTTSPGTWSSGPDIPSTQGAPDAAAAMMVNGKILMVVSPVPTSADHFPPPATFYVFDYTTNTFTSIAAPGGGTSLTGTPTYVTNMLCLPNGQILYATQGSRQYYVFTPTGTPLTAGKPTVDSIIQTSCNTFTVTGKLFNGISEGAGYGDDWQMSTNYPIVRITSGSTIYYARSYNWNRTAVMTGTALDTAQFTVPSAVTTGSYTLEVIANGNASTPHTFIVGPVAIAPATASVCTGHSTTLTDATAGGTWSSSATSIATVGSATGVVNGLTAGTARITYAIGSCNTTRIVTVNATPTITPTGGSYCVGVTTTLTGTPAGGTWSSTNTAAATVGSTSGIFSIVAPGFATISYTLSTGCFNLLIPDINALPAVFSVTGGGSFCTGGAGVAVGLGGSTATSVNYQLYNGSSMVGSPVTGTGSSVSFGLQTVVGTYTVRATASTTGCQSNMTGSAVVTTGSPASISGPTSMCAGSSVTLTDATTGGTWTSGSTTVATVGSSTGLVTGVSGGTAGITYSVGTGCSTSVVVTVGAVVSSITGPSTICKGSSITLSDATSGGSWTSSNTTITTVTSAGVVHSLLAGTVTISYSVSGCAATTVITVNETPVITTPASIHCAGGVGTFTATPTGGAWTSDNASITIDSFSGAAVVVAPVGAFISYTLGTGCLSFVVVDVNPLPTVFAVTGGGSFCSGGTGVAVGLSGSESTSINYQLYNGSSAVGSPVTGTSSSISFGVQSVAGTYTVKATRTTFGCQSNMSGSAVVTVLAAPAAIGGPGAVCVGGNITLTNTTTGGTWSSSNTSVASIDPSTGIVTGAGGGTANITYSTGTACIASKTITVNTSAASITGASSICQGTSTTLTDATTGGSWGSSNTSVAAVGSSTGIITGVGAGTAIISYSLSGGCGTSTSITVNANPAAITGPSTVMVGATITLTESTTGGTFSSSSSSIASVDPTSGVVSGAGAGSATISYILPTGCYATYTVIVIGASSGGASVCVGSTTTLSGGVSGGTWISGNTTIATIGMTTGIVTGISPGIVNMTYTVAGIPTITVVTVSALPAAIGGGSSVCVGLTATVTNSVSGGLWSSSSASVATVDAVTGIVTGITAGSVVITYTLPSGCFKTAAFTVKPLPASISGSSSICVGTTATFTDATTGGLSWTSSNTSVASVGSTTGIVTGISAGTAVVTYQLISGCYTTMLMSVAPVPAAISGSSTVCVAGATTFSSTDAGGTWSSSSTVVATVDAASGVVTGMFAGSAYITYTLSGCRAVHGITVNVTPSPITGTTTVCMGSTATLSDVTTGGTWSSDNGSVAAISSAGVVTGAGVGSTTISYATSTCSRSVVVTVTSGVSAITGATTLCTGSTSALADATSGGSWSSSNTAVATIGTSGIVTGVSGGTASVTYSVSAGCRAITVITVSATLPAITGATAVNIGSTTTFSDATSGGSWSSSNTSIATVNSSTGVVTGVAAGSAMITYGIGSGCFSTKNITVNAAAAAISGSLAVCVGSTSTLTDATTGGVSWTSNNTAVATIGATSGIVAGVSAGTAVITYTVITGAYATAVVTVNSLPAVITGTASVCAGSATMLSSASMGGTWSSSNALVATADASTGTITGVAAGSSYIYYSLLGCSRAITLTVNPLPAVITGVTSVCNGSTATLSSATTGGAWTSSTPSVATISGGGLVTGVTSGTSLISYTLSTTGCARTTTVSVGSVSAITGNLSLCISLGSTLADASTGGTWSSSNPAIASITSTGLATGVAAGTTTITYALSAGCRAIAIVTVSALPSAITGATSVCVNSNITLASVTTGGTWSSSNPALGSVDATGVVTGVSAGTPTFSYTLSTGCYRAMAVAIKALPGAITGTASVCVGTSGTLTDPTSGGLSWASSNTAVATIGSISGVLTGVSVGTSTITFTLATGCITTAIATVNPGLSAGTVTGPATVSLAASIASPVLYTNGVSGGTWSTSNTSRATIGAVTGLLTGVSAGAVTVTYTVSNSCQTLSAIKAVTITSPRAAGNDLSGTAGTVQLYPNPTTGNLTLQAPAAGTLTVYTLEGKQVQQYQVTEGNTALSLPKSIAAGVYMCRYAGDDGSSAIIRLVYER